jgi:hypothetical protein
LLQSYNWTRERGGFKDRESWFHSIMSSRTEDTERRRREIQQNIYDGTHAFNETIINLPPDQMSMDLTCYSDALIRQISVLEAKLLSLGPASPNASSAPNESAATGSNEEGVVDDAPPVEESLKLGAPDAGWEDVSEFSSGIPNVKVFRKAESDAAFQKYGNGTLRLQRSTTDSTRRFVMHQQSGSLLINMKVPDSHQLVIEKRKNVESGRIVFVGINGAANRGFETFAFKTIATAAQQLGAELNKGH